MKAFFSHYSMKFGLYCTWDYTDYDKFAIANEQKYKDSVCLTLTGAGDLTEWDIYQLSKGNLTEQGQKLFDQLLELAKKSDNPMINALMVSMHSGSSDYLLPFKVLRDSESFKKVLA